MEEIERLKQIILGNQEEIEELRNEIKNYQFLLNKVDWQRQYVEQLEISAKLEEERNDLMERMANCGNCKYSKREVCEDCKKSIEAFHGDKWELGVR